MLSANVFSVAQAVGQQQPIAQPHRVGGRSEIGIPSSAQQDEVGIHNPFRLVPSSVLSMLWSVRATHSIVVWGGWLELSVDDYDGGG